MPSPTSTPASTPAPSLVRFAAYFLRLGATGFGGAIALSARMQRDLVDARGWVDRGSFTEGLALAQLAPGPLAAQLAIYLGWLRGGILGATLVGAAFVLPSFLMVLALSAVYVRHGGLPWMQGAFYGIGAVVIAIIARGALKLARSSLKGEAVLWGVCAVNAVTTVVTAREVVWVFFASGLAVILLRGAVPRSVSGATYVLVPFAPVLTTGLNGAADATTLLRIGAFFGTAGAFVFGSGLAIVPFLRGGVVDDLHWLTESQFLDAVAVAMITPGPVVISVAFIGYLVAGLAGATVAAAGVFVPCYLVVIVLAPVFRRVASNQTLGAFVAGVTAAACGALMGAVVVLGTRAIRDVPTAAMAGVAALMLWRVRRLPEPLLIGAAALAGLLIGAPAR